MYIVVEKDIIGNLLKDISMKYIRNNSFIYRFYLIQPHTGTVLLCFSENFVVQHQRCVSKNIKLRINEKTL